MKLKLDSPYMIEGDYHIDDRGKLEYFNNFDLSEIKRNYIITHFKENIVRAWQGHKTESRWFVCLEGSFDIKVIEIDNWVNPSEELPVIEYKLTKRTTNILYVPNGFVNGFISLEKNSKLLVYSNYKLNELLNDEVRYDKNKWVKW